jgi:hypothetical protein
MEEGATESSQQEEGIGFNHCLPGLAPIRYSPVNKIPDQNSKHQAYNELQSFFNELFQNELLKRRFEFSGD